MADHNDLKRIRRTPDPVLRNALLTAMKSGYRYKMLNNGIVIYGKDGVSRATFHFTNSDHRATANAVARLRNMGVELPKRGQS